MSLNLCICDTEVVLVCCGCKVGVEIVRKNHGWGCLLIFVSLTQRWCWCVAVMGVGVGVELGGGGCECEWGCCLIFASGKRGGAGVLRV